jgi:protein-disulfide isomerase
MKNLKNPKNILFIVGFIILALILIFIIIRAKNNNLNSEAANKLNNASTSLATGEAKAQVYAALKNPTIKDDDKIIGSKKSALTVFVYEDNANIYSAKLAATLDKIYSENQDKFSIVVRPFFPQGSLVSRDAALAIECAGDQNKWVEMRAYLFDKAKNESLNLNDLNLYVQQLSLDETKFSACLTNAQKSAKIEGLAAEAADYNVIGAPTMFINNEVVLGARPYDDYVDSNGDKIEGLKTVIEKKLK